MTRVPTEADKLDKDIGGRVRLARKSRGLSQTELGKALGVTFQQVQKYERGSNRISSSALVLLARELEVSPMELLGGEKDQSSELDWDMLQVSGAYELLRNYRRIVSPKLRKLVLDLTDELADEVEE